MKKFFFLLLPVALLLLAGCATRYSAGTSFVGEIPKAAAQRIAGDAVDYLSSVYPPGHTSICLIEAKDLSSFRQELEDGLRARGFTLARDNGEALTVAYVLDGLDTSSAYLRLVIADPGKGRLTVTRAYSLNGEPAAGFSTTKTGD